MSDFILKSAYCYRHIKEKESASSSFVSFYCVAGYVIRIFFADKDWNEYFDTQMSFLKTQKEDNIYADVYISTDNLDDIVREMDSEIEYFKLSQDNSSVRLRNADNLSGLFISWDSQRKKGIVTIDEKAADQFRNLSHNLTPLFQLMAEDLGVKVIHSACVGTNNQGVLIGGLSGSGKSTLAVSCLEEGMDYVSDDTVLFDPITSMAYPICSTCHINFDFLNGLSTIASQKGMIMNGRANKKHIDISNMPNLKNKLRIEAIIIPVIDVEKEPYIVEVQRAKAIRPIVMSTSYQIGENINSVFARELFHSLLQYRTYEIHVNKNYVKNATLLCDFLSKQDGGKRNVQIKQ